MKKRFISLMVSLLVLMALALPAGAASVDLADPEALLPVEIGRASCRERVYTPV